MPIPKAIALVAVPASVGFFFHTMYNVVDTFFAGHISTEAVAALSLAFPLFFAITSLGNGLGTGATALIGHALGANDEETAQLFSLQALTFGTIASLLLTVLGITASPLLFRILGAKGSYLGLCLEYMNTIFAGSFFFILIYMFNASLNAQGNTQIHRNFLVASFFANCVLNPWFVRGGLGVPAMGVGGIALATVLIQVGGAAYMGFRAWQSGLLRVASWRNFLPRPAPCVEIARQGFPASISIFSIGLGIFVITYFVSRFGEASVAAYGVATRVEQIVLLPTIGLNIATLTIVAQSHGAMLGQRIFDVRNAALKYGAVIMAFGTAVIFFGAETLMSFFTDDPAVVSIGTEYLHISAFALYAYVILFVNVASLQGVKRPMFAVWIGLGRQVVFPVLVFTILVEFFNTGTAGIWWGIFSITWLAALVSMVYANKLLGRVTRGLRPSSETSAT
ncbi:MAG: MATE family efflux transporter [Oceanidesulfovibrio sp.]